MRCDRGRNASPCLLHELHSGACRYVLEDDAQSRMTLDETGEHRLDEAHFAIKDVDRLVSHLAVHLQDDVKFAHARQHGIDAFDVRDARCRVSCRPSRVEFATHNDAARLRALDLGRLGSVGEVKRHQRFKFRAARQHIENALAIRRRERGGGNRQREVWHDDGARKAR